MLNYAEEADITEFQCHFIQETNLNSYRKYGCLLYLAADMPVIVWKDAAIADFILKNEVGIVVESLDSLEGRIKDVSHEEYRKLCENACRIGELVREGYYFEKALTEALETLTSKK